MIRVLVVDDSPTMRALLMARLENEPDIEVIGAAANAAEARAMMRELDPDVVTLDIEMPGMNGLDFLDKIMRLRPTPVIIVSGLTDAGAEATARALALGAVDCYSKRALQSRITQDHDGHLAGLIRQAARVKLANRLPTRPMIGDTRRVTASQDTQLIAIGSSTGGVEALQVLLGAFPADCPPTMIVQHINAGFAPAVARRLDEHCAAKVVLAESDTMMKRGHVYFAPGGERHMTVRAGSQLVVRLRPGELISGHRPSVDALFLSVAEQVPGKSVGILLTGMGHDGARGLLAMRKAGCFTIAQDEATSIVYGMPRAAAELGAADMILALPQIAPRALAGARA